MAVSVNVCCECGTTATGINVSINGGGTIFIPDGGSSAYSTCAGLPPDPDAYWEDAPGDSNDGGTFCADCVNGTITSIEWRPVDPNTGQGVGAWTDTGEV